MFRVLSLAHHVDILRSYMPGMSRGLDVHLQHDHIDGGVALTFARLSSFKLCIWHFVGQSAPNLLIMSMGLTWNTNVFQFIVTSPTFEYVILYISC